MKKIVTIIGARPQFIKAAALSRVIAYNNSIYSDQIEEIIIHTGQHFDSNMSTIFFDELGIPTPNYNLDVSGLSHGSMTGRMLEKIEKILIKIVPNIVLIYGDTNSTLAGALAASKLDIPVAHVEAGLRSFNMKMPEEINRIISDRISTYLFCPTNLAVKNLKNEGINNGVFFTGDVMLDVTNYYKKISDEQIDLNIWGIKRNGYALATIHRAENTNNPTRLKTIFRALNKIGEKIDLILPIHPRTANRINELNIKKSINRIKFVEPVSFLEMIKLQMNSKLILTDSGGIQKEAFFHKKPCITLRDETEWKETVDLGWNKIVGADFDKILKAFYSFKHGKEIKGEPYGDGNASNKILEILKNTQL